MLSLEDQIKELADYAFDKSEAVQFEADYRRPAVKPAWMPRLLAAAAALAILAGGLGVVQQLSARSDSSVELIDPAIRDLIIDDPLDINLDPLIQSSDKRRIGAIGEYTTFDFQQLPEGWSAEQNFAVTSQGLPGSPATFWQQVFVSGPGPIRLVVNVTGFLDGSPPLPNSEDVAAEGPAIINGREILDLGRGRIRWTENETSQVEILNNGLGLNTADEALELAGYLVPVTKELDWQLEATPSRAEPREEWRQLSGEVDGIVWHVSLSAGRLELNAAPDFEGLGGLFSIIDGFNPSDPTTVISAIESVGVPGGVVVFGHAPETVNSVRLTLENGTAIVPVVKYHTDRVAFAVPISDRLDPISVEFLDEEGEVAFDPIPLSHLPPYTS